MDALGGTALRQGLNAASTVGVGPVDGWSVSLSGGFSGYGVVHYLPLDGTVFSDSRSVGSKPFIGMATAGIAVRHRSFVFFLGRTYYSKTFETERQRPEFGTFSMSSYFSTSRRRRHGGIEEPQLWELPPLRSRRLRRQGARQSDLAMCAPSCTR